MDVNSNNVVSLKGEEVSIETDALMEERKNAKENYSHFNKECERLRDSLPYANVGMYSTGIDYEDIESLQYKKSQNISIVNELEELSRYCREGSLYCGHLLLSAGTQFYFTDSPQLRHCHRWVAHGSSIIFVHSDDANYRSYWTKWKFPKNDSSIRFSRNISMRDKKVIDVSVLFDSENTDYSSITDNYLRNALKRNKEKEGIQSIIQTIQEKQDDIRALNCDSSFVVQGCAGSGKTMVLLHRLRYLLYNHQLAGSNYYVLVPSNSFTRYIKPIANDFKIRYANIFSYQRYYRYLLNKGTGADEPDISELVFSREYLQRIYSFDFIQECYSEFLNEVSRQYEALGTYAEDYLVQLQNKQKDSLQQILSVGKMQALSTARHKADVLLSSVPVELSSYEDIPSFCDALDKLIKEAQEKSVTLENVEIKPDDPRLLADETLQQLDAKIEFQAKRLKQASTFTRASHEIKMSQLVDAREQYLQQLIADLQKSDAEAAHALLFCNSDLNDLSIQDAVDILSELQADYTSIQSSMIPVADELLNFESLFAQRHADEISSIQHIIETSFDFQLQISSLAKKLSPLSSEMLEAITLGTKLYASLAEYDKDDDTAPKDCDFKIFTRRSPRDQQAYMDTLLFNICRKKVNAESGVRLCNKYKHYWYLSLYCKYLTAGSIGHVRKYIFMDEAQDLSPAELDLIYKLNTQEDTSSNEGQPLPPIMNIFGDVNQMITSHGISNWEQLPFSTKIYELTENFRNTNQIIEFCNTALPFHMQDVGVDMDDVREYEDLPSMVATHCNQLTTAAFVVKDEYAADDLKAALQLAEIQNANIYTVKDVKGLEFKEVIVVDRDMTDNEKYIAYTRAMISLCVIHNLPVHKGQRKSYIVQGEAISSDS